MADIRPKRPTLQSGYDLVAAYDPSEVDAWNTYRDRLLRELADALDESTKAYVIAWARYYASEYLKREAFHPTHRSDIDRYQELVATIRESLEE